MMRRLGLRIIAFEAFCRWFDFQHHSMLIDISDDPLILDFA
jgi:hypothetical protein